MTTTTNSLTDRYVEATLRRLPNEKRPDIERELRAAIADAVDDRVADGTDPAEAEVAVLTELGDPARLAAGYADRPLHLIGPELFLDYTRLLRTLFVTIVPIVAAAVGLVQVARGGPVGPMIGTTVGAAITTTVHIFFWTTLAFVAIERTRAVRAPLTGPWTPALLPVQPSRLARFGELMAETVALVLFGSLLLLAPRFSPKSDADGNPINILSPWLWESGFVYVFIGLVVRQPRPLLRQPLRALVCSAVGRRDDCRSRRSARVDLARGQRPGAQPRLRRGGRMDADGHPMDPHWTDCDLRVHDPAHHWRGVQPDASALSDRVH